MNDNKNIIGVPLSGYLRRLRMLQDHYLGAYKARVKNGTLKRAPHFVPGSEAERVYKEGRY